MRPPELTAIAEQISAAAGLRCAPLPERDVAGGSIDACYKWPTETGYLFVKVASRSHGEMLDAQAQGLRELAAAKAIRVPRPLAVGVAGEAAFLALEWIETRPAPGAEAVLGEQLARQHRVTRRQFGWHRDNTIGSTPQANGWMSDWIDFYRARRLRPQLELAVLDGHASLLRERGARLLECLDRFFADYRPLPSLLHGDLWGGNWFAAVDGAPVVFDPATYYGDREADIAMTRLFGGFGPDFYRAYENAWPLDSGGVVRRDLYNLYHVLNHAHLFGGGYVRQAREMIDRLLAHVR